MHTSNIKDIGKQTQEITLTIPWSDIEPDYAKVFKKLSDAIQAPGFRKGMAPAAIAKRHIPPEKLLEQVADSALRLLYPKLIQEHKLEPIMNPSIELIHAKEGDEWKFTITIALTPAVELGKYKEKLKEKNKTYATADKKVVAEKKEDASAEAKTEVEASSAQATTTEIEKSPDEKEVEANEEAQEKKNKRLDELLQTLLEETNLEVADMYVNDRLNRKISQMFEELQRVGLSLDQYIESKKQTIEEFREEMRKTVLDEIKLDFALEKIIKDEKLTASEEDLQKIKDTAKSPEDIKIFESNLIWYKSMIERQKGIDYLMNL